MTSKRDRALMANHYAKLYGDGPVMPVPPKRVQRQTDEPSEHQIQASVCAWWRLNHRHYGLPESSLYANPAGGAREAITGARLKAEGVRRGVPDLTLAAMRNGKGALYLEMKRPGGSVSLEQKEMIAYLNREGYAAFVCWSVAEAQEKIVQYLRRVI